MIFPKQLRTLAKIVKVASLAEDGQHGGDGGVGHGQGDGKETLLAAKRPQSLEQQVGQHGAVHGQEQPPGGELHALNADHHQVGLGELDQVHKVFHFHRCTHFHSVFLNRMICCMGAPFKN